MRKTALALSILLLSGSAQAANVGGANLSDKTTVGGQTLVLNGGAVRKKLFIKVYAAGLYLPTRQVAAERILATDTPRQMVMHFLYDVDKGKIAEAWQEGLQLNVTRITCSATCG